MKTINASTKRGQELINAYNRATAHTLRECYGRFSYDKERADYLCRAAMLAEDGHGYRIMSYNTFQFTCGWMTAKGLRVETARGSYIVVNA